MCNLPTKQDPNSLEKGSPILNHYQPRSTPIPANRNGSDNGPPQTPRQRCYSYHCRPQMFPCSSIHPLRHNCHWGRYRPIIPQIRVQMVRNSHQDNNQPRPTIHLPFWMSPHSEAGDQAKPIFCIPPPNGWDIQKKESMGGTIPTSSNLHGPQRLDPMARPDIASTQQLQKRNHRTISKQNPPRI
jgi:hypothetical protein